MVERNGLIEPENYFAGYEKSIKENATTEKPPIDFGELCFKVLGVTEDGKGLLEMFKERFIFPSVPCNPTSAYYSNAAVYYEGYREAFRQIIGYVEGFKKRKHHEAKMAELGQTGNNVGEF